MRIDPDIYAVYAFYYISGNFALHLCHGLYTIEPILPKKKLLPIEPGTILGNADHSHQLSRLNISNKTNRVDCKILMMLNLNQQKVWLLVGIIFFFQHFHKSNFITYLILKKKYIKFLIDLIYILYIKKM